MKPFFQRAPAAWFALALLIMFGVAMLVYSAVRENDDIDHWVAHTHGVMDTLNGISTAAGDTERGAHSYVLTGEERFLTPFRKGRDQTATLLDTLDRKLQGSPSQIAPARHLRATINANNEMLATEISLRRDNEFNQARDLIAMQPSASDPGSVGSLLAAMKAAEDKILAERTAQSAQARRTAFSLGVLGVLLNIIITGLVFEMLRRENRNRVHMQLELTEANQKISASLAQADLTANRLTKTVENIPLGVLLVDAELRVVAFNDCLREMLGAAEGAITPGDDLEKVWLFGLDDRQLAQVDRKQLAERRRRLIENPQPHRFERVHNGRLLEARGTPVPGGGFIKIYTDITTQRAEARKLLEERNTAEEIARAKSDFLAVMSHEVRTPMNGVMGIAELLLDTELSPEQKNYVDIILRSGENLLVILNDILDLSKVEANKVVLEATPFDPRQVLTDLEALWGPRASEKGLALTLNLATELPQILVGDAGRLRQVISNLIGNAMKFTERGEIIVEARWMAQDMDGAKLSFSVTDTGIGISEEQKSRLFQPFSQADASTTRRFGGTGLGLAICLRLVEKMGGRFDVTSVEDEGSTFSFTARFPLGTGLLVPESAAPTPYYANFTGRVLVVEDHPVNRAVARASMARLGLSVAEAQNGREAVELAMAGGFDLVFMDMHMPVMDGLDATRQIRLAEVAGLLPGRLPIVAMTANVLPEAVGACIEAGMDGYLCKPFTRRQLAEVLDHWLPKGEDGAAAGTEAEAQVSAPVLSNTREEAKLAATEEAPGVIDPARYTLLEETMGEEIGELLESFRRTSLTLIPSLQAACESLDWQQAFRDAHTLTSSAAMVGAVQLNALARLLETQCKAGGTAETTELATQLDAEYARVDEALAALAVEHAA